MCTLLACVSPAQLQELLKRLSGAQQLVQRVMDLESSGQQQELALQQLRLQLAARDEQLEATSAQLLQWQARAQAAEQQVVQQAQQLGCSTPRPKRDLGLLCDLVEPLHQQLIERALVAGANAS
jgi:type VI protein secretion system component VasA